MMRVEKSRPKNSKKRSYSRQIAAIKRQRTAKLTQIITKSYYLKRRGQDEEMANFICDEFVALGGVYTKFLQGVLLRTKLTRKWTNPLRNNVFENLDTELIDIGALLQRELPPALLGQIAQVQPQPFAAGSFGQVYYATLRNGQPVVIKALRPMIRETLKYDLRLLSMFAKTFFVKLYPNITVNLNDAIEDFRASTLRETDYIFEANFALEQYETYKDHPQFLVPKTYTELCTPNIIVQDYVGGVSCAQLLKLMEQGVDPKIYVKDHLGSDLVGQLIMFGFENLYGVFTLPRVQGDPHPGNVKILDNNRVGLIDFGIAAPAPQDRASFFGFIKEFEKIYSGSVDIEGLFGQFIRFFVSDLYKALKRLSELQANSEDMPDLTRTLGKVAHQTFEKQAGPLNAKTLHMQNKNLLGMISQVVNKQNRFGLVVTLQSSEMLRASQTYMSLVGSLGLQDEVLPVVFSSVIEKLKQEMPELEHDQGQSISVGDAIETVTRWLERVAARDPALFTSLLKRINLNRNPADKEASTNA